MAARPPGTLLDRLERGKTRFGEGDAARMEKLLARLARYRAPDAESLIRLHEALLFVRAYPHSPTVLRRAERLLATFPRRVARYIASEADDVDALTEPEVSGIAGTRFSVVWGYDMVRHLAEAHPSEVDVDWDAVEDHGLLNELLKQFLPLFEDAVYAETTTPGPMWIRAAKGRRGRDLPWLLRQIGNLSIPEGLKTALFDALSLPVDWKLGRPWSRTGMRVPARGLFYHRGPLIGRRDVAFAREIVSGRRLPVAKLTARQGARILSLGRDQMAIRFRELHGFTYGDPGRMRVAEAGRGVRFFVWGVPPERRLPMIGYHAALIVKNGVPTGYAESLGLFERTECGLNLFYTFREGESAWIFARLLRLFRQILGITVISVEPYQVGHGNEEAIDSGAFWFYRKLGFRPVRPELERIAAREERRIAARPGYRTPPSVLRKLATGHVVYDGAPAESRPTPHGEWDQFHFRNLGLAVQRRVSEGFRGDGERMRADAEGAVVRALGIRPAGWDAGRRRAFRELAPGLALIPGLSRWSTAEKRDLVRIIAAKAGPDEAPYLRLLQDHPRLRAAIISLGSANCSGFPAGNIAG